MQLLEKILARNKQVNQTSRDIRVRKWKVVRSQMLSPIKANHNHSCNQIKNHKNRPERSHILHNGKNQNQGFQLLQKSTVLSKAHPSKQYKNIHDYLNAQYTDWPSTIQKKDLSLTLNPSKSKIITPIPSSKNKKSEQIGQQCHLKVEQLAITHKKQTKRKQIVEALNRPAFYTPQVEIMLKRSHLTATTRSTALAPKGTDKVTEIPSPQTPKTPLLTSRKLALEPIPASRRDSTILLCGWQDDPDIFQQ